MLSFVPIVGRVVAPRSFLETEPDCKISTSFSFLNFLLSDWVLLQIWKKVVMRSAKLMQKKIWVVLKESICYFGLKDNQEKKK